ncbi:MAG TPA: NHL repeat-containing protein [Thermomicrobiales bacterium]|nr:NHL repeat-containing protein [Thermomicrobiales bacterium]
MVRLSLTVAVTLALLLAACGSDDNGSDGADASPTTASATATASEPGASPTATDAASPVASPTTSPTTAAGTEAPYELVATWGEPALLAQPFDVAVTPDGGLVVANLLYGRLVFLDADGKPTNTWDIDIFSQVAVDGAGNIYVRDSRSRGLTKYDSAGNELATLELGTEQLQFSLNDMAASEDGYLYATSGEGRSSSSTPSPYRGVYVFEPAGERIAEWAAPLAYHPQAVTVGPDGVVYVSAVEKDAEHMPVRDVLIRIDPDSYSPNDWLDSQIALPEGTIIDALAATPSGELYALRESDPNRGNPTPTTIIRMDTTGTVLAEWTVDDVDGSGLPGATGIAAAPGGGVYLTDGLNHRVLKLDPDGNLLVEYGEPNPATISIPTGIMVGADGTVYVRDSGFDRILTFSPEGEPAGIVDVPGEYRGFAFTSPPDVAVGADGVVWATQSPPTNVYGLTREGDIVHKWTKTVIDRPGDHPLVFGPGSMAVTADNTLLISNDLPPIVFEFSTDGEILDEWTLTDDKQSRFHAVTVANGTRYAMINDENDDPATGFTIEVLRLGEDGALETVLSIPIEVDAGSGNNAFIPVDCAIDRDGNIFLADLFNRQILKYGPDGNALGRWSLEGDFERPNMFISIAIGDDGRIYVADGELQQVFVYAPVG